MESCNGARPTRKRWNCNTAKEIARDYKKWWNFTKKRLKYEEMESQHPMVEEEQIMHTEYVKVKHWHQCTKSGDSGESIGVQKVT